ncbi:DUF262 domain-containing protein [Catenuloplanes sp. NPDC051500]|uniref:GmrSD restriction endonuclease domain-containing protein n=1 Tax=Catenuloplanes sp. NPDC051500 TaxID=3363959 RepID=UPI0037AE0855
MAKRRDVKGIVDACGYPIGEVFRGNSYSLDYYQRDYVWEEEQVERLLTDLAERFLLQWREEHLPGDVNAYEPYFLGPFIVYQVNEDTFLADGQQRVITLLLLLIYLSHLVDDPDSPYGDGADLRSLVIHGVFPRRRFAVDVDVYDDCFDALVRGRAFNTDGQPPNVRRVYQAYQHIEAHFPLRLRGEALGPFIIWLLHRVSMVAINAGDRNRAQEMFQTMNDRGVRLSPMDHLKHYLLRDAEGDPRDVEAQWREMVASLEAVERGAAFGFVQAVFRARYADLTDKKGPSLNDATHEWVREHQRVIWPQPHRGDGARFISTVLRPLSETYLTLLQARGRIVQGLEAVRFNAANGITEQFDLTIAAVRPADSPAARVRKARLVANFIDLFVVTNGLNNDPCDQMAVGEQVGGLLLEARHCRTEEQLKGLLGRAAAGWVDRLVGIRDLRFRNNGPFVHYLLARLTAWLQTGADDEDPTDRLLKRPLNDRGFEIEHLFTATASKYAHLVPDARKYGYLRSRIGALVLLDGPDNSSYGGKLLSEKLPFYLSDMYLAAVLNPGFLQKGQGNVKLRTFIAEEKLTDAFVEYTGSEVLEDFVSARGIQYHRMAERIWRLDRLGLDVKGSPGPPVPQKRPRAHHGVHLADLISTGLLAAGQQLVGYRGARSYFASVLADGSLRTTSGAVFRSPSAAMMDALDSSSGNGWLFWHTDEPSQRLDALRKRHHGLIKP